MKQQIAGFLGELAEELGWSPELEHARVREETTRPEKKRPTIVTPDPQKLENLRSLATPADRLQAELNQLHATVKHLGSEVIQLRAQMAQIRSLPTPPDAPEIDELAPERVPGEPPATASRTVVEPEVETEAVADVVQTETAAREARPWPPQLVPRPDVERAAAVATDQTVPSTEPVKAAAAVAVSEPTAEPPSPPAEAASISTPTVVEVDTPDSALELFPSEPAAPESDSTDPQAETESEEGDRGAAGYVKSLYRRMGGTQPS